MIFLPANEKNVSSGFFLIFLVPKMKCGPKVSHHLLSPIRPFCRRLLGELPDPTRGRPRQDGDAHHSLPRAHKHFQHNHHQLS